MEQNELLIIYGRHYKEMTKTLLTAGNITKRLPGRDALIGIKPNLLGPIPASEGATTHAEVAAGVIEFLQEAGWKNLVLLESSWVGDKTADSLLVTGYDELCRQYRIPFWDLQEDKGVHVGEGSDSMLICERALQIDYLINLPVLKGHCQTRITCALKNMKGLLPASEKRRFHRAGLHEPIGRLSGVLHQDLILVDSICGDLTFEDGGHPVEQNRLMLTADPVLCDSYGCHLLGIDPNDIGYIKTAEALGVGKRYHSESTVIRRFYEDGSNMQEEDEPLPMQNDYRHIMHAADVVTQVDTCSACYARLLPALLKLDEEGLLENIPDQICIGQGYRGKSGRLGIGNCTKRFDRTLAGCPPQEEKIEEFLRALAGSLVQGSSNR